jgi:glycyl-tRNA synthetase alpha subunit
MTCYLNWYSHSGHLEKRDIETKLFEVKHDQKQVVELTELLMSEVIQSEALINILDRKGIVSKAERLEEMKKVKATMVKSQR